MTNTTIPESILSTFSEVLPFGFKESEILIEVWELAESLQAELGCRVSCALSQREAFGMNADSKEVLTKEGQVFFENGEFSLWWDPEDTEVLTIFKKDVGLSIDAEFL